MLLFAIIFSLSVSLLFYFIFIHDNVTVSPTAEKSLQSFKQCRVTICNVIKAMAYLSNQIILSDIRLHSDANNIRMDSGRD